jgi:hypothetical protein
MKSVEEEIVEIVNSETRAWGTKEFRLLMTSFHYEKT